ncbi:OprO/OprP family phosphate-selective porin [Phenylobacterium sp. LjRoot219]|uniref:OprO/OprP family phosphate-selective porin n=1 Tax=Phenylobacterium sp. LjRoot219 TaxID=3342283 RepID=UPI003F502C30
MPKSAYALFGVAAAWLAAGPAAAQAGTISAEEAAGLRAEIAVLKAQINGLEQRLYQAASAPPVLQIPAPPAKPAEETRIRWKGSPEFVSGDRAFKVKGRIQADAGYVSQPPGLEDPAFGFANEFRRIRLGGEGALGAGIGYKLELELSDNAVDLVDTFVTYETGRWLVTAGNHNAFQALDELTGDTTGSFMERAAFTDAFNFERRLGVSAQYRSKPWLVQAGVFTDDVEALSDASDGPDGGDENDSFSLDARLAFGPRLGDTQLHLGGSAHWRKLNRLADATTRYRQRPYLHANNSRIVATPALSVDQELNYGLEAALIRGSWHLAGEGHWLRARRPGAPDAAFFGGYGEVGWFLTRGDGRGYRDGQFTRNAPARPLGDGGFGSLQLNLRYDYLSLNDGAIRGGVQRGYLGALIWAPLRDLRINLNYGYLDYQDAALAAVGGERDYGVHVGAARFELDF